MSAMLMCACAYVHRAFDAINFPATAVCWYAIVGSLSSQSVVFMQTPKCNQNQPIWIFNFIFFSCFASLFLFRTAKSGKSFNVDEFSFSLYTIWCTIYAFMRLLAQIFHFHQAKVETKRRKRIENESLWLFVRLLADCISFMMALVFFPVQWLTEKLKVCYCGAFVCTKTRGFFYSRGSRRKIRLNDNLDFFNRYFTRNCYFSVMTLTRLKQQHT